MGHSGPGSSARATTLKPPPVDIFLESHRLLDGVFTLGGLLEPVSIRDQMIRARMMVDRAFTAGLIGPHLPPLLIVGAGAAGVTAALRATEYGVEAVLVEAKNEAFTVQFGCSERFICPTSYDWPVAHWPEGEIKWGNGAPLPMNWKNGRAKDVASNEWKPLFLRETNGPNPNLYLTFRNNVSLPPLTVGGATIHMPNLGLPSHLQQFNDHFAMAIFCVGLGEERTYVKEEEAEPFRGFAYWKNDFLRSPNYGCSGRVSLLISGGGDGALQDFLRATMKPETPREIYESLTIIGARAHDAAWRELERKILSAESYAQRAFSWSHSDGEDNMVWGELHQAHEDALTELLADSAHRDEIYDYLDAEKRSDLPDELHFVYGRGHFPNCYALNRFLVLLLKRYFADKGNPTIHFWSGTRVTSVAPSGFSYTTSPEEARDCWDKDHQVTLKDPTRETILDCNAIILRHGIKVNDKLKDRLKIRQILPFQAVL